jgi:hypothetical protein
MKFLCSGFFAAWACVSVGAGCWVAAAGMQKSNLSLGACALLHNGNY